MGAGLDGATSFNRVGVTIRGLDSRFRGNDVATAPGSIKPRATPICYRLLTIFYWLLNRTESLAPIANRKWSIDNSKCFTELLAVEF